MTIRSYGSTDTVWSRGGELGLCIESHLINNKPIEATQRLLYRIGSISLIIIGQIPISRISISRARNRAIGWVESVSNGFAFGLVNVWANEKIMNKNSSASTLVKVAAVAGGLISQLPGCYMAYFYNNNNIFYVVPVLIANTPAAIYSLNLMLDPNEKKHVAKQYLIDQLSQNEQAWIELVKSSGSMTALPVLFEPLPEREKTTLRKAGYCVAQGAGALFASANTFITATLGFKCAEEWTDSSIICSIVGFGVAFCTIKLFFEGTMKTTARAYNYAIDYWTGAQKPPLASQLRPRLTMTLWLLGLALSAFAFEPSLMACQDNYSSPLREGMQGLVPAGLYLIIANAITDLVNEIVLIGIDHCDTEEKKLIVQLHNQLEHVKKMIAESSDEEFIQLKDALPDISNFCKCIRT